MKNLLFTILFIFPFFGFSQELYQVKKITNYQKLIEDLEKDSANW